ncbi:transcriptional regulator [bacterium 1XD21-13]|nr:transcriptional regulator [bacterium 1XD21-13]
MVNLNNHTLIHELKCAQKLFTKKWLLPIIVYLFSGPKFWGELLYYNEGISKKVLSESLRELQDMDIVKRTVYSKEKVKQVEYSLTPKGHDLQAILEAMAKWGAKYMEHNQLN